jgi:NAD(P)-dependent dehydrogenase (short-subunit alcohol dehydrogenase family)
MNEILITGGSGKVGFQLVNHFLNKKFKVVTTSRNSERFLKEKESLLHPLSKENLRLIEVDFTEKDAVEILLNYYSSAGKTPTHIIHNARSLDYLKIEADKTVSNENFAGEFFMDVIFPYRLSMEINKLENNRLKNLIFISSMYGVVAPTPSLYEELATSSPIHYGVSKAAQIHLTKELAVRLAPKVRVNCVSFGGIKGRAGKDFEKRYNSLNPLNKMLEEADVVGPVDFLVSDSSKDMTGQNIQVDGGWTIW